MFAALNVAAVTALAPGGAGDDISQNTAYPFVLFELHEKPIGGFGTRPGVSGQLPQIDLIVHVFSQYGGMRETQAVMDAVIGALATPPPVVGYSSWAIFHDETIDLGDQDVGGVKVKELIARFRLFVELQ